MFLQEFYLLFPVNVHFFPTTTLPYSRYIITVNIHIDQVLYFLGFCFGEILSQHQFYLLFTSSNTVNTQYRANHVLGRFCSWGDFAPGKILSRVGFSPMIYHSITLNIHQDQVMYFSGFFVVGGFHPNKNSTFSNVNHYS